MKLHGQRRHKPKIFVKDDLGQQNGRPFDRRLRRLWRMSEPASRNVGREVPVIEVAPDDETAGPPRASNYHGPIAVCNLLTDIGAAEVEAVVDILVDIDKNGEVIHTEIARWAGFNLDEAVIKQYDDFTSFPRCATACIPMRVLLRYNFRKPPR